MKFLYIYCKDLNYQFLFNLSSEDELFDVNGQMDEQPSRT